MRDLKHQGLGYLSLQEVARDLASAHKDYQIRNKRPRVHPETTEGDPYQPNTHA